MSTIQHVNSVIDHFWPELHRQFPGFEKPQIVPAATLRRMAPLYMATQIDKDPTSMYFFIQGQPGRGDVSREAAKAFFDELFYEKLRMPSSYDVEAGGEFTREQAIDMEVLPPAGDRQFQDYYDEQMAALDAQNAANADDEFEQKHGFRRDDPSIIDVTDQPSGTSSSAVANRADTSLGKPKQIFFAVNAHIPAGGMLGYDPSNRLGRRDPRASRGYLREGDGVRYATDRLVKLCEAGELKWETVCREALQRMSEDDVREMAEQLDWFQMDEGEMNEKHVEGIDNVLDALDKVKKLTESLDESVDYNAVGQITAALTKIADRIGELKKVKPGDSKVDEAEEFDPQNLDKEIAEAGKAAEEIDSKESDPLDESVSADVGEWNRILGSIR